MWALLAVAPLAAAISLPAGSAAAAPAAPSAVVQLRAEMQAGTLLSHHGVGTMCSPRGGDCHAPVVTTAPGSSTVLSTDAPVGLGATDLERAYHLPSAGVGNHATVALITSGAYPALEHDLGVYRQQYGLAACTTSNGCLRITDADGGPPVPPSTDSFDREVEEGWAEETALDVDMASAACPACHILVVQTSDYIASGNPTYDEKGEAFATAYTTAVRLGADAVSLSDMIGDTAELDGPVGEELDHQGVPLMASAGDVPDDGDTTTAEDSADAARNAAATDFAAERGADDGPAPVEEAGWPQDLPWVVSVGGTALKPTDSDRTAFTEQAWTGLTGSCDKFLPPAGGQPPSVAANCGGHRAASDIAAVAALANGPAVYDSYAPFTGQPVNWVVSGGTSASSPFVAGWYARSAHNTTTHGPSALYGAPRFSFHDITTGTGDPTICSLFDWPEAMCQAGPGWDGPTGLGTPNGLGAF
jgi:hypothetical protein